MKSRSVRESHKERRNTPHYDFNKNPIVKDYYLVSVLGSGAFGRCFKAYHFFKHKYFALKVKINRLLNQLPNISEQQKLRLKY